MYAIRWIVTVLFVAGLLAPAQASYASFERHFDVQSLPAVLADSLPSDVKTPDPTPSLDDHTAAFNGDFFTTPNLVEFELLESQWFSYAAASVWQHVARAPPITA
ncbi:hypothetical protein [Idiomarina tyrosinivorans]|uniref:hypothetical protein n=1 Tax=Idiomarina tyrosinivorans TaxID=1445662 RepID=UPI000F86FC33|nr:hypothetical protein [Idiomarina tyrosinivorans]